MLPLSSDAPDLDPPSLADGLGREADSLKCFAAPPAPPPPVSAGHGWPADMREFEKIAGLAVAIGYLRLDDPLDTCTSEGGRVFSLLMNSRSVGARMLRKSLEAKIALPTQAKNWRSS